MRKEKLLSVSLPEGEAELISRFCKDRGISISHFLRRHALKAVKDTLHVENARAKNYSILAQGFEYQLAAPINHIDWQRSVFEEGTCPLESWLRNRVPEERYGFSYARAKPLAKDVG